MDSQDYNRIEEALRYLEENALDHPSLERVAAHLGLSPSHFQRVFKRWAGVSPKRFLQYLTVERAKKLLHDSASVLDAAHEVGLSGPGRLHDLFVAVEAVTPGEFKTFGRGVKIRYGFHPSPFGTCLIALTERGICHLAFVDNGREEEAAAELRREWRESEVVEDPTKTAPVIGRIFGQGRNSGKPPLRLLLRGTNFQLKVWEALLKIPEGAAVSYSAVAEAIGQPTATRAVAGAIGKNRLAYLIPCHRVLRSTGEIGGYRWGTPRKKAMLAREMEKS